MSIVYAWVVVCALIAVAAILIGIMSWYGHHGHH